MANTHLTEIAERLSESGIPPHFEADQTRLLIKVWKQVVKGLPVPVQKIEQFAVQLKMPATVATAFINQLSEHDEAGNIIGILGLSQKEHPHKFIVGGRTFFTWCAWDALFLPPLLKQSAQIVSSCPQSQKKIRVNLTPQKVISCDPANTALSIILPETTGQGLNCVEEIWSSFCCNVRFFSSRTSAREWFSDKEHMVTFLTVEEGFQLGALAFGKLLAYA